MKRFFLLLVLLAVSLVVFVSAAAWYLASYQPQNATVNTMMSQMMGNSRLNGAIMPMPSYLWVFLVGSLAVAILGAAGVAYYAAFPEIRSGKPKAESPMQSPDAPSGNGNQRDNLGAVVRTFNPDERKVVEVLLAHGGTYLQKFIVKESGLSRLKIHRIVSRFAERGIVTAVKSGNTNAISLAPWLRTADAALG